MGMVIVNDDTKWWKVCLSCGAEQGDWTEADECRHWSTTENCDDEDCEACNNDPDLWRAGVREAPFWWSPEMEDDEFDQYGPLEADEDEEDE